MTILDKITAEKRRDVARRAAAVPAAELERQPLFGRPTLSASHALTAPDSSGIIAEFKRRSPSKGELNAAAEVGPTTAGYVQAGAACLSVLTDEPFFGGTDADFSAARAANPRTPILRKDFILTEYQVLETKALGADLLLLIAACLSPAEVAGLSGLARELGLEVLLEVHDEAELRSHYTKTVDLVGVNNRDLRTFQTSVAASVRLASLMPAGCVPVSESGLRDATTIRELRRLGYRGFLVGETFMRAPDPAAALAELAQELAAETLNFSIH